MNENQKIPGSLPHPPGLGNLLKYLDPAKQVFYIRDQYSHMHNSLLVTGLLIRDEQKTEQGDFSSYAVI